ncbi:MAG TPA: ATP-binding protein [Clostridia bacterium]|nr:ATP-binding protein [Clostridia bacterium]
MVRFLKKYLSEIIIALLLSVISTFHYIGSSLESPYHNFYRLLYVIPIILGAFRYGFKGGTIVSLIAGTIYSPHILLTAGIGVEVLSEAVDIILFFTVGLITGTLAERKNIEKRKLDEQLRQYKILDRYSNSIIESIKSGVVVINNDMLITIINKGAKRILEVEEDFTGSNFIEVFSCCENVKDNILAVTKENKALENIEMSLERRGLSKVIRISFYPLNYESLKKGLVVILDDITELKALHYHAQRNDKLAAIGELASGFAHEIRNPLAIIKAIEQTMCKELKENSEAITELTMIDEEVERANRVVKLLMDFAKPDKHERGFFSINTLVREVLMIAQKYISQHGVEIKLEEVELPYAEVDKELLKQAFINLIFNAVDAMPDGGILYIQLAKKDEDWIRVSFKDTGLGIEKPLLSKIFDPFFTTKDKGTGLGLSIVHRIVDEHKGIINVSSEVGVGTCFEVLIPLNGAGVNEQDV